MKRMLLCVLFIVLWVPLARAGDDVLTVTQDESSMERVIERYLKANYSNPVEEKKITESDLELLVKMEGKGGPDFDVVVDTQSSNKTNDGTVIERVITVQIYTGFKVPADKRAAMFEAINKFQAGAWFASIYIDEDEEISVQWCVNVMKQAMPTEYVTDAVIRVADTWRKFRPDALKAAGKG